MSRDTCGIWWGGGGQRRYIKKLTGYYMKPRCNLWQTLTQPGSNLSQRLYSEHGIYNIYIWHCTNNVIFSVICDWRRRWAVLVSSCQICPKTGLPGIAHTAGGDHRFSTYWLSGFGLISDGWLGLYISSLEIGPMHLSVLQTGHTRYCSISGSGPLRVFVTGIVVKHQLTSVTDWLTLFRRIASNCSTNEFSESRVGRVVLLVLHLASASLWCQLSDGVGIRAGTERGAWGED